MKPVCEICGSRHEGYQAHVFATNAATNKVRLTDATNSASNSAGFPKERKDVPRSEVRGNHEVSVQPVPRPIEGVEEMGLVGSAGIQRGLQHDGRQPGLLHPRRTKGREGQQALVEDVRMECGMDGGARDRTPNRRSRESYNAYQREYMRKRRGSVKAA